MRSISMIITLIVVFGLSGCLKENKLDSVGLNGLSGKEILTSLANEEIVAENFAITVYDNELIVILEDDKISIDMPEDEFYLSVAPYVSNTHECLFHSATGCRGELKNEMFFVEFVDSDGNIVFSESISSLSNGFIDLWLPRDIEGVLSISHEGLTTSKEISTFTGQPTCETTMQLS